MSHRSHPLRRRLLVGRWTLVTALVVFVPAFGVRAQPSKGAAAPHGAVVDAGVAALELDAGIAPEALAFDGGVPASSDAAIEADIDLDAGVDTLLDAAVDAQAATAATPEMPPPGTPWPSWPYGWWPAPSDGAVPSTTPHSSEESKAAEESRPARSEPSFIQIPVETTGALDEWLKDLGGLLPRSGRDRASTIALFLILWVAAWLFSTLLRRWRRALPETGLLPAMLGFLHGTMRVAIAIAVVVVLTMLVPPRAGSVLPLVLVGAALAVGWSLRDVLPDLIASLIIVFERKIRRGEWVKGDGFSGIVERVGLRALVLRDARGYRVVVPNRLLLAGPLVSHSATGAEREVSLRIETKASSRVVRQALRDAILFSPWVASGAEPVVFRDPVDPQLWHIRARLLDLIYASRFSGDLLERVEEILDEPMVGSESDSEAIS